MKEYLDRWTRPLRDEYADVPLPVGASWLEDWCSADDAVYDRPVLEIFYRP